MDDGDQTFYIENPFIPSTIYLTKNYNYVTNYLSN